MGQLTLMSPQPNRCYYGHQLGLKSYRRFDEIVKKDVHFCSQRCEDRRVGEIKENLKLAKKVQRLLHRGV